MYCRRLVRIARSYCLCSAAKSIGNYGVPPTYGRSWQKPNLKWWRKWRSRAEGLWGFTTSCRLFELALQQIVEDRFFAVVDAKECSLSHRPSSEAHGIKEHGGDWERDHVCTSSVRGLPLQSFETEPRQIHVQFGFASSKLQHSLNRQIAFYCRALSHPTARSFCCRFFSRFTFNCADHRIFTKGLCLHFETPRSFEITTTG